MTKLMTALGAKPTAAASLFDNGLSLAFTFNLALVAATVLFVTWVAWRRTIA